MLPTKFWAEMSWRDFAAADMSKVVAVLPVAAIEQHGPHLPVGVDTFINEGYLAPRRRAAFPTDMPVLFLPVQAIGKSNEHIEFPGTLTFSLETVTRAWTEIGDSVARTGCRKLIFMNSHGGNVPVIDVGRARTARAPPHARGPCRPGTGSAFPTACSRREERAHGIHGGDAETSLMLAFRPEHREDGARRAISSARRSSIEQEFKQLRVTQPIGFGWMASDLHEAGAAGDAVERDRREGRGLRRQAARPPSSTAARRPRLRSRAPAPGAARG